MQMLMLRQFYWKFRAEQIAIKSIMFPLRKSFPLTYSYLSDSFPLQRVWSRLANLLSDFSPMCPAPKSQLHFGFGSTPFLCCDPVTPIYLNVSPLFTKCIRDCSLFLCANRPTTLTYGSTNPFTTNWYLLWRRVKIFPSVCRVLWLADAGRQ